jgi:ribonuclease J
MARIAADEHPDFKIAAGDRVIFSSRAIPGNEKAVGAIINGLVDMDVEVITDRTHLVHVSGHPRRGEVERMYRWIRPQIAVPAHGEALHLSEHRALAKQLGVAQTPRVRNGDVVRLAPGGAAIIEQAAHGRWLKDGHVLGDDEPVRQRRRIANAGIVSIAVAVNGKGDVVGVPDVTFVGLPERGKDNADMGEAIDRAVFRTLDGLPRARRRDPDAVSTSLERAVRNAVGDIWGKKPTVHAMVVAV